jgi:hypothetical protein
VKRTLTMLRWTSQSCGNPTRLTASALHDTEGVQ